MGGGGGLAQTTPPPPAPGGAEFLEAPKARKKIFGLNELAPFGFAFRVRRRRKLLIGRRPGGKFGPIF